MVSSGTTHEADPGLHTQQMHLTLSHKGTRPKLCQLPLTAGDGRITVFHIAGLNFWPNHRNSKGVFSRPKTGTQLWDKVLSGMHGRSVFFGVEEIIHTLNMSFMLSHKTIMDAEVVYLKLKTKNKTKKNCDWKCKGLKHQQTQLNNFIKFCVRAVKNGPCVGRLRVNLTQARVVWEEEL